MRLLRVLLKLPTWLANQLASRGWALVLRAPGMRIHHSSRIVGQSAMQIGTGFQAGPGLWLHAFSSYGTQVFQPRLVLGERVCCSDQVHIACADSVTLGDDVLIGSKVHITDHNHGQYSGPGPHSSPDQAPGLRTLSVAPVVIESRVFLADGVIVLPGVRIGSGTIVGANAVVTTDLPADCLCVGAPARAIKRFDRASSRWLPL